MKERTPSQVEASLRTANLAVKTIFETLGKDGVPLWSDPELKAIDAWISRQSDPAIDRREAVRRLVELGLKAKTKP